MSRFFRGNASMVIIFIILAANTIIRGDFLDNPLQWLINTLLLIPGIIIGITVHEFAHAFMAYKLGDMTPKFQKRVTLNPLAHIDPIGLIALLFIRFGWGKPVQVNPLAFKKPRLYNFLTDIAGITMNFIFAILFMGVLRLVYEFAVQGIFANETVIYYTLLVIGNIVQINIVLMIFNLLPVPPLDGFGIITEIFNLRKTRIYEQLYNAGFPILIVLIVLNVPTKVISPIIGAVYTFLFNIFF